MNAFQQLGLSEDLLKGITALGFETPTPVQQLVIPVALEGNTDLIALAHTGTGKTAAFGLPLLERIDPTERGIQALVLCPTRELCVQVASDLENYSQFAHQYKVVAVYGGASIETQIRQIKAGAQIIVATPGRLMDLMTRKAVRLETVHRVVLDEADEMLNMGFKEAIDFILAAAEERESIWLFSATMPSEVRAIAAHYMDNPRELSTGNRNETNANIQHQFYLCRADDRFATLKRVVDANPGIYGLIFCRTKVETQEVAEQMIRDGYNADALHGDLAQADRDRVMQRFRENNLQLLIATDVAARGLDVSNISHVINYGLPDEAEVYTHRSGRTGRAGKQGISISIITPKYEEKIRLIERKTKAQFTRMRIPTGMEVCEQQLYHIIDSIKSQEVHYDEIEPFMAHIQEELKDLSKEELIKRFASVEFNRFLAYYRNAPDINIHPKGDRRGDRPKVEGSGNGQMQRLFINVGEMDGVNKKDFLKLLSRSFGVPSRAVGHIDMNRAYMHFDLDSGFINVVRKGLSEFTINGRRIRVDDASPQKEKSSARENRVFDKFEKKGGKGKKKW
ncbi:MAG: DEAD/DEAH box helicase [Saprospiraceae bacterium]|nr:DEAD/DEAH box helicase [Saprospiraceae bacterium]